MHKRVLSLVLALLCLAASAAGIPTAAASAAMPQTVAEGILAWKRTDLGVGASEALIGNALLDLAGTTPGDWYPFGLGRWEIEDNYAGYLAVIRDRVEERYRQPEKLSAAKATEWHRIALAVAALGGDPTSCGQAANGDPINLIADGTYDRGNTTSLGRQGINGWIWGLIALDSRRYAVPAGAHDTRDTILTEILRQQLADGGFALSGTVADPDITAMAVQALAPYYNSEQVYAYAVKGAGATVSKTVHQVTEEALACLSALQLDTGGYESWGTANVESADQVLVALCCLGLDPLSDARFIKNGHTLLDGIFQYRMADGGFVHSFTYDPDNPTSLPDQSNSMAGEQTLYAMAALWRQQQGMRTLYDCRPEPGTALRQRIETLNEQLAAVTAQTDRETLRSLLTTFYALPEEERSYVTGYWTLAEAARAAQLDVAAIAAATPVVESPPDAADGTAQTVFTDEDRRMADTLPRPLTTEQYVLVTTLLDKVQGSVEFDGRAAYIAALQEAKTAIAAIQTEIDRLNADIKAQLYPYEQLTLRDRAAVNAIVARYTALSPYDRTRIAGWEDVLKTKTKLDDQLRGIAIGGGVAAVTVVLAAVLWRRIRKRRRRKALAMEELAREYADEE